MALRPAHRIVPFLYVADVSAYLEFLAKAFGFETRRHEVDPDDPEHENAESALGEALVMISHANAKWGSAAPRALPARHTAAYVSVPDVDAHCARARAAGAVIESEPTDMPWGDRIYQALDPEGHQWFFAARVLPDVGKALAGVLARLDAVERPLLVAYAERLAAERYRSWAKEPSLAGAAAQLLACAAREEEIASRVEGLFPGAEATQRAILARHPDLMEINRTLFAKLDLRDQLTVQSRGERLGAATWRSLARQDERPAARETYLACAELEEASALVLEAILTA